MKFIVHQKGFFSPKLGYDTVCKEDFTVGYERILYSINESGIRTPVSYDSMIFLDLSQPSPLATLFIQQKLAIGAYLSIHEQNEDVFEKEIHIRLIKPTNNFDLEEDKIKNRRFGVNIFIDYTNLNIYFRTLKHKASKLINLGLKFILTKRGYNIDNLKFTKLSGVAYFCHTLKEDISAILPKSDSYISYNLFSFKNTERKKWLASDYNTTLFTVGNLNNIGCEDPVQEVALEVGLGSHVSLFLKRSNGNCKISNDEFLELEVLFIKSFNHIFDNPNADTEIHTLFTNELKFPVEKVLNFMNRFPEGLIDYTKIKFIPPSLYDMKIIKPLLPFKEITQVSRICNLNNKEIHQITEFSETLRIFCLRAYLKITTDAEDLLMRRFDYEFCSIIHNEARPKPYLFFMEKDEEYIVEEYHSMDYRFPEVYRTFSSASHYIKVLEIFDKPIDLSKEAFDKKSISSNYPYDLHYVPQSEIWNQLNEVVFNEE